ncbi:MAG TPA: TetR family transcriptional regulator [Geodermatophilus sp.]|nr:TetR family transcriptional regulator [Geodermatophilus sp.]
MPTPPNARTYSSPRRARQAAQTRAEVIAAATKLFLERGWAGTTMAAVAAEAEVAVDTVYAGFSSKAGLLAAAKDVAKVGDDEPVPLMQRPGFDALDRGSREDRIEASATLIAETNERTRAMDAVWREAAASERTLAAALAERESGRRQDLADGLARVLGRPVDESTLDTVWVLTSPDTWAKLHGERHWHLEDYRRWLVASLDRLLPPAAPDS